MMDVLSLWRQTLFLREERDFLSKGWLLSVMKCIDKLQRSVFSLADIYRLEAELMATWPDNRNVRPKIRQQLQVLRDKGYLTFLDKGVYRLAGRVAPDNPDLIPGEKA
jgi:type II restriction enzyme